MECRHYGTIFVLNVMKKWFLILALALTGCDEGRIYDDFVIEGNAGATAAVKVRDARGYDRWFSGYSLAVAGFSAGSEYALISKNIELDGAGNCEVVLSGIPSDVQSVELCVVDRLRRRVAVFNSVDIKGEKMTNILSENDDLSPESAIQREIFNTTCINCHGGANFAAASLNLTEGRAFQELIGVQSVKNPQEMRVKPGSPEESVLYKILSGTESAGWNYDHSVEITSPEKLDLIKNWIKTQ